SCAASSPQGPGEEDRPGSRLPHPPSYILPKTGWPGQEQSDAGGGNRGREQPAVVCEAHRALYNSDASRGQGVTSLSGTGGPLLTDGQGMTEREWLEGADPWPMLEWLRDEASAQIATARKLRLFACACCRLMWEKLPGPPSRHLQPVRQLVEVAERF